MRGFHTCLINFTWNKYIFSCMSSQQPLSQRWTQCLGRRGGTGQRRGGGSTGPCATPLQPRRTAAPDGTPLRRSTTRGLAYYICIRRILAQKMYVRGIVYSQALPESSPKTFKSISDGESPSKDSRLHLSNLFLWVPKNSLELVHVKSWSDSQTKTYIFSKVWVNKKLPYL